MPRKDDPKPDKFVKANGGNIAITAVLGITVIVGAAAAALDYSRMSSQKSQMASALDSALLASAVQLQSRDMTKEEVKDYLSNFFFANADLMGLDEEMIIHTVDIDWENSKVSATVETDLPLLMRPILGKESAKIAVGGSAVFGTNETEVAMTFDITGSMSGSKLASLKTAARSGIEELLSVNTATRTPVRISLVPYADAVNVGNILENIEDEKTVLPDECKTERKGKFLYTDDGPGNGPPFRDSRLGYCPESVIQPLTSDLAALEGTVDGLEASGFTAGHIGIQWAWFTLSPNWAPYLPEGSRPTNYEDDADKFAIIMTDGLFNTAYANVPNGDNPRGQSAKSRAYALKLCENMKEKGVKVFTIGFALKSKDATDTMAQCASPADDQFQYFYQADDGSELTKVYELIARRIKTIRLSG